MLNKTPASPSLHPLLLCALVVALCAFTVSCERRPTAAPSTPEARSPTPDLRPSAGLRGQPPTPERVAEIAKMLTGKAVGLGSPISERAAWTEIPGGADLVSFAEQSASAPVPEMNDDLYLLFKKTGSRREFEDIASRRRMRLTQFVLAECIENKGRFLAPAEREIAAILEERAWTLPAHDRDLRSFNGQPIVDLAASQRGWILALIDYLLGEKLRPETRAGIRAEVARRVLLPYRDAVMGTSLQGAPWIHDKAKTNWNPVCHAGVVGAALALGGTPGELAWYVSAAESFIASYFDGFGKDGYCPEGLGYWNYGFGHFVMLAETVGRASAWQIDFFATEKVSSILAYPDRIALFPGVYPAFSDMDPSVQPEPWIAALADSRSGQAGRPCRITKKMPLNEALAAATARCGGDGPRPLALRDEFPDAGVYVLRGSGASSGKGLAMAFNIGNNGEPHNHNDVGSYVVASEGCIVLADPGAEVYTARTFGPRRYESRILNSFGHPVPAPDGALQDIGPQASGLVVDFSHSPEADAFLIDLRQAYAKSVPGLALLTRRIEFLRAPAPEIRMTDTADFRSAGFLETALVTFGACRETRPGTLIISQGDQSLAATLSSNRGTLRIEAEVIEEKLPGGSKPVRVGLRAEPGEGTTWISYSLRSAEETSP